MSSGQVLMISILVAFSVQVEVTLVAGQNNTTSTSVTPTPTTPVTNVSNNTAAPRTLPPTTGVSKTCCFISVTLKKNDDKLQLQKVAFKEAIERFFNDSADYTKVNLSNLELKEDKEDKFDMTLNLCVVQIPTDGFIEDFFLNQVKDGKLLNTSIHENSFKCKALGVKFSDWEAKDGECKKCSDGGGGPIEIKGKCEPEPGYSCRGLKNTKKVNDCLTYCDTDNESNAVSIMVSTLVMAAGIAQSLSYNIWE